VVTALTGLVGFLPAQSVGASPAPAYGGDPRWGYGPIYQTQSVQRIAHRLDDQLDDLRNAMLRSAHHEDDPYGGGQEMRFIMSVSALRGQADSLHYLLDRREPADVRLAFREMAALGAQIDREIRSAHVVRQVADLWGRSRTTLNDLGRAIYGNPRWDMNQGGLEIFLPFPGGNSPWGNDHNYDGYYRKDDNRGGYGPH